MTVNFEVLDNIFQIVLLMCMVILSFRAALKLRSNLFFTLACAYSCFMMGTLYWMLYIAITSDIPHTFYVSEISWIASYIFFLSVQIIKSEGMKLSFSPVSLICACLLGMHTAFYRMMGPSYFFSTVFAITVFVLSYVTVFRMTHSTKGRKSDIWLIVCIVLQLALYTSSAYISDYTGFNLYFAIDISFSLSLAAFYPILKHEAEQN